MRIAIDCRLSGISAFLWPSFGSSFLPHLLASAVDHTFILLSDRPLPPSITETCKHFILVVSGPKAQNAASRKWWYDVEVPRMLIRHQADWFIGLAGYISLHTKIPQVLVLHDALGQFSPIIKSPWQSVWYKQRLPKMLDKARKVFVPTPDDGKQLPVSIKPFKGATHVLGWALPGEMAPADLALKQAVKEQWSDNKEYFLCPEGWQTEAELVALLKAFSQFKKRLQSGTKLVLAGVEPNNKGWKLKLESYRYRQDVVITGNPIDYAMLMELLAATYCFIYLGPTNHLLPALMAMQLGVPVITLEGAAVQNIAADTILYAKSEPPDTLAQLMITIYKNENLRNNLVQRAIEMATPHHWPTLLSRFWQAIYAQ